MEGKAFLTLPAARVTQEEIIRRNIRGVESLSASGVAIPVTAEVEAFFVEAGIEVVHYDDLARAAKSGAKAVKMSDFPAPVTARDGEDAEWNDDQNFWKPENPLFNKAPGAVSQFDQNAAEKLSK